MNSPGEKTSAQEKRRLLIKEFLQKETSHFASTAKLHEEKEKNLGELIKEKKGKATVLSFVGSNSFIPTTKSQYIVTPGLLRTHKETGRGADKLLPRKERFLQMQAKRGKERDYRVQFILTKQGLQEFDLLMSVVKATTRKDVFNSAIALLQWTVRERLQGRAIASIDEATQKYREIDMPIFPSPEDFYMLNLGKDQTKLAKEVDPEKEKIDVKM